MRIEKLVCRLYDIATPSFLQLQKPETLVFKRGIVCYFSMNYYFYITRNKY